MNPQKVLSAIRQKLTLRFALLASITVLFGVVIISGAAQSTKEERELKNTVPDHVPIKVKVKNEKTFKDMKNKNWARELEVEVKNTGTKPIYFMYMTIRMEDLLDGGHPMVFQVFYGRKDLFRLYEPILPDDVPIPPGETVTLKIAKDRVEGYEYYRDWYNRPDPKKIRFDFGLINFGDGTGLHGWRGAPLKSKAKERALNAPHQNGTPAADNRRACSSNGYRNAFHSSSPASFLRVNFSPAVETSTSDLAGPPQSSVQCGCQNNNRCQWGELGIPSCCDDPNTTGFIGVMPTGGCVDPSGACFWTETVNEPCPPSQVGNPPQTCQFQENVGPCAVGDPPPSPSPSPSPSPAPTTCDPNQPAPDGCFCNSIGELRCCDMSTRPNPTCECMPVPGINDQYWDCGTYCSVIGGTYTDYPRYPANNGCPSGYYNDGAGAAVPTLVAVAGTAPPPTTTATARRASPTTAAGAAARIRRVTPVRPPGGTSTRTTATAAVPATCVGISSTSA